jgi:hypothetical protein
MLGPGAQPAIDAADILRRAATAAEALSHLAEHDPNLGLRAALELTRHVLAVAPPRPRCFVHDDAKLEWIDDPAPVEMALALVERALQVGGPAASELETARQAVEALRERISAEADAGDYDTGCRAAAVVASLIDVVAGRALVADVGLAAARASPTPDDPRSPMSTDAAVMAAADARLLAHRGRALLAALAGRLGEPVQMGPGKID